MANKTFATYLSELSEVSSLGAGDKLPVLESSTVKYVDGGDIGGTSYLKYVALLSQTGTDAPVATVLENTLGGTVVFAFESTGTFSGTLAGVFTSGKTYIQATLNSDLSSGYLVTAEFPDEDSFVLIQRNAAGATINSAGIYVEIRVYP